MNSVVKDYIKRNKVLIQYVYDSFGYRYACVVATGKGKIGWSMVHHTADSDWKKIKPQSLPAVQRMALYTAPEDFPEVLLKSKVYQRYLNTGGVVKVPLFNRERAIEVAINRALNNRVGIEGKVINQDIPVAEFSGDMPKDPKVVEALFDIYDRSRRAKW